jgi:hypothetical protein
MVSSGMLYRVASIRTEVSEEPSASFIRATTIGELGISAFFRSVRRLLVTASVVPSRPDEGGAKFLRNAGSYKSHSA